jgi:hypothetical protein
MHILKKYQTDIKSIFFILGVFLVARLLFILLMPYTFSNDIYGYVTVIEIFKRNGDPYKDTFYLNYWPPFWMQILYVLSIISKILPISSIRILQFFLIIIEALVIIVSYGITKKFFQQKKVIFFLIIAMALNPISILLTCQHGNFDFLVELWILLFIWSLINFHINKSITFWLMACFFLGIGIITKTIPIILIPLLLPGIQNQSISTKLFGFILLFTPVVIGMSIIIALEPHVFYHTMNYRSGPGWFGITGIFNLMNALSLINFYVFISPFLFLTFILFISKYTYNIKILDESQIISICLLLLLFIPTFGPGYASQYISWFLPIVVILYSLSTKRMKNVLIIGYIIASFTYLIEYAFFTSHGAFMTKFIPTEKIIFLSNLLSTKKMQFLIRLPLFLFYLMLFLILLKNTLNSKSIIK